MSRRATLDAMDLDEALTALLGDARTGTMPDDAIAAACVSMQRRRDNTELGGTVFTALRAMINPETGRPFKLRELARATGIPKDTIARWSKPPPSLPPSDQ